MNTDQPPIIRSSASRRLFLFLKIAGICVLIGLLHIPLGLTRHVLTERQNYQSAATDEIAGIWGRRQLVTGPVLVIPYAYKTQVVKSKVVNGRAFQVEETELTASLAHFLPDALAITGTVDPEVRHRGIYEAVVYATRLELRPIGLIGKKHASNLGCLICMACAQSDRSKRTMEKPTLLSRPKAQLA